MEREKQRRRWGRHVTANHLMATWARLVDDIATGTYPDHVIIEEYANDLDSRKLLQVLVDAAPREVAEPLADWLTPLDRRFHDETLQAHTPIHGSPDPTSPHAASPWHWRIPKHPSGELAKDLARRRLP